MHAQTADVNLAFAVRHFQADPGGRLGPGYVGVAIDAFFFGIQCCQISSYRSIFPKDSTWNKGLVGLCFILALLKTLESVSVIWQRDVSGFGNWYQTVVMATPFYLDPILMVALTTTAQMYFARRCFLLTGRSWLLLIFLGTAMSSLLALSVALTLQLRSNYSHLKAFHNIVMAAIILSFVVDVVITSTVWYKLAKSRRESNGTASAFLTKWIALTYECAIPPVICQLANMIGLIALEQKNAWSMIPNTLTPRLYVFSMMYTLNSRLPMQYIPDAESYGDPSTLAITNEGQNTAVTLSTFMARHPTSVINTHESSVMASVGQRSSRAGLGNSVH